MGEKKRRLVSQTAAVPSVAGEAGTLERAGKLLAEGRRAHRGGQLVAAINAYQAVVKLAQGLDAAQGELAQAQHYQGLVMLQMGQAAIGLNLMRLSLQLAPENAEFHFNLGRALRDSDPAGKTAATPAALEALGRAAELAPDDHDVALVHVDLLLRQKREADAIAELERAHRLRPQRWETLRTLVELYHRSNQAPQARAAFVRGLALHPDLEKISRPGHANPRGDRPGRPLVPQLADLPGAAFSDEAALQQFLSDTDLHIVDDFLPDPDAWRERALALPFHQQRYAGQNYPGAQTHGYDCQEIMDGIASTLGRPIKFISPDNGSYRLSFADDTARTDIHVDNESGDNFNFYAAVLYLNRPEQCQGGTTFWQQRTSGWQRRPAPADVRAAGYPSFKDFQKRWLPNTQTLKFNQLQEQRDNWLALLEVPMRQNRLITYRGHYFHSISNVFGSSAADGRLVQLFFFEVLDT